MTPSADALAALEDRMSRETFRSALRNLINMHSLENGSNTPDFILAEYLQQCLLAFDAAVSHREQWYGRGPKPVSLIIPAASVPPGPTDRAGEGE